MIDLVDLPSFAKEGLHVSIELFADLFLGRWLVRHARILAVKNSGLQCLSGNLVCRLGNGHLELDSCVSLGARAVWYVFPGVQKMEGFSAYLHVAPVNMPISALSLGSTSIVEHKAWELRLNCLNIRTGNQWVSIQL